jgi:cytochrome c
MHSALKLAVLAVLLLPVAGASADDAALIEKGRALIAENCSRCHAIGKQDASKHPEAPPFRDVMKRYPAEDLAEALAEGIVSGHPDMPEFTFEPDQIDAIVAYLDSLREDGTQ